MSKVSVFIDLGTEVSYGPPKYPVAVITITPPTIRSRVSFWFRCLFSQDIPNIEFWMITLQIFQPSILLAIRMTND